MAKSARGGKYSIANNMNIPYEKWGKILGEKEQDLYDAEGNHIGYIGDYFIYHQEVDVRPVTKKQVLQDIDDWRMDDGTYGNEDTAIYLAYKDGTFVDLADLDGKPYKKSGIIGASIQTGDYQMVWGGEISKRTGQFVPWETSGEGKEAGANDQGGGRTNSYSGYKTTGQQLVRRKVTYNNAVYDREGKFVRYRPKWETLRKSTIKKI